MPKEKNSPESKRVAKVSQPTRRTGEVSKTLGEAAYRLLRRDILSGRLPPGYRLQFRPLVQHYDLGIAPLREALSKLASERLVSFEGQRGFAVAPVSREELHEVCTLWAELSAVALRMSIERGDEAWAAHVQSSAEQLSAATLPASPDDFEAIEWWERLHSQFHRSLTSGCGAPWREHFCSVLCDQFERYRRTILLRMAMSAETAATVDREHREIAEATMRRDSAEAVRLLTAHFEGKLAYLDSLYTGVSLNTEQVELKLRKRPSRRKKSVMKGADLSVVMSGEVTQKAGRRRLRAPA
ncbi:FCD domain-containing protein [Aquabacter sp. CN5-332]|uniref:GntR family transcriptional regulator n=1 Tax=Aquabacter sp. CN5-332 TaxID=3156608 RepID=UPI0032B5DF53